MEISRRELAKLAGLSLVSLAAGAVAFRPQDEGWITVCSTGKNLADRVYDETHMAVIARDIKPGMQIRRWCFDDENSEQIKNLFGIVTEARRMGGDFQIKARWLKSTSLDSLGFREEGGFKDVFATIHGTAQMHSDGAFELIEVLHLDLSMRSTFTSATAV